MRHSKNFLSLSSLLVFTLLLACGLVSGTFVVSVMFRDIPFTAGDSLYFYEVDLDEDSDWEEHSSDIESIDAVGFELWITNHEAEPATFSVYLDSIYYDPVGDPIVYDLETELVDNGVPKVLDGLTIDSGPNYFTYGQSLTYLDNVGYLSDLMLDGSFHFYGVSTQGDVDGYTIDSVRVVVTVTISY